MARLQYIMALPDSGKVQVDRYGSEDIGLLGSVGDFDSYLDSHGDPLMSFGPVSAINILIGPTNSGKSRFLRALAKTRTYTLFDDRRAGGHISRLLRACGEVANSGFTAVLKTAGANILADRLPIQWDIKANDTQQRRLQVSWDWDRARFLGLASILVAAITNTDTEGSLNARKQLVESYRWLLPLVRHITGDPKYGGKLVGSISVGLHPNEHTKAQLREVADSLTALLLDGTAPDVISPSQRVYVPVLRSAVALTGGGLNRHYDVFGTSVADNYGIPQPGIEIFTGNRLYLDIREARNAPREVTQRLKEFERFLSERFFGNRPVELKPLDKKYDAREPVSVCIGQAEREFHNIGDGVQSIIILMYKLFMAEDGAWVFIEEPEQGLHPGLQRIFLDALATRQELRQKDLRVFLTTHSNHLLGMALSECDDVSVFSFQQVSDEERFAVRPIHSHEQGLLTHLGVSNSSVFLANCGIWVEGVTDRKYLRAYLQAYQESGETEPKSGRAMQEDIHYAFFEYGGSSLAHYLFDSSNDQSDIENNQIRAQFLSNRIFLLSDRDEQKEEKHRPLREAASESGNLEYFVTQGIEIENLLSERDLSRVLPDLVRALGEADVGAVDIRQTDYRDERIGAYLEGIFPETCANISESNGALRTYYKTKLADLVCPGITWDTMSDDAKDLARHLYAFVQRHNP